MAKPTTSLTYTGSGPWVEDLWIDDYPDAQDFTSNLLSPESNYNGGNYSNPAFEKLITQALIITGGAREQLYVKASRIALSDVAWSMIGQGTTNWRWDQTHIKGMTVWTSTPNPEPKDYNWAGVDVQ